MGTTTNLLTATATTATLVTAAPGAPSALDAPPVLAQAGVTVGPRYDLGPRYDPYSESWKNYRPPPPCQWVTVRVRRSDGRVVEEKRWGCRVPARQ